MTVESWLPVVGFSHYDVSDHGQVWSRRRVLERRNGSPYTVRAKMLTPYVRKGSTDYMAVGLRDDDGQWRNVCVHVIVLTTFVGPKPNGMEACHGVDGSLVNAVTNLRWDTRAANMRDQLTAGTHGTGSKERCKRGHLLCLPNLNLTLWERDGRRFCLACEGGRNDVRTTQARAEGLTLQAASDRRYDIIMEGQACR